MEKVLITGGSGLIGLRLTDLLLKEEYEVIHLSRKKYIIKGVEVCEWNEEKNLIDHEAVLKADHIIHLAGATVAKRWTKDYKQKIMNSRISTAKMIFDVLSQNQNHVKTFISTSAVGFYANTNGEKIIETSAAGIDFLSEVCKSWEAAANRFLELQKRVVIIRTGIVFAKEGGSFPELYNPLKFGIAPVFAGGKQFYPWIHIDDLCKIYVHAIKSINVSGTYNGCAPNPVTQLEIMNAIAKASGKRKINFPVSAFVLKLILGEFANSLVSSLNCSSEKIEKSGYDFKYSFVKEALESLFD